MIVPSTVFHLLLRPPPDRGVLALDLCAPGKPGSASPFGNGRLTRVVPIPGIPVFWLSATFANYWLTPLENAKLWKFLSHNLAIPIYG
jgi:hypothetical protein